jgi:ribosomal protein L11 methyltransferase
MHTQFKVLHNTLSDLDVFIYHISSLPISGMEELDNEILFYAEGDADSLDCATWLQNNNIAFEQSPIPVTNWNALWESNFDPVFIDDILHIRASFHPSLKQKFKHEILINPKMSFGTGHHATTQQVIILMQQLSFKNNTVLDFGTGTGVLAIHASQLGASQIDACDNDPWCIDNSQENVLNNNINNINVFNAETPKPDINYNIVLANVNRHILLEHGVALSKAVLPKGHLIISGILNTDVIEMNTFFNSLGFTTIKSMDKNNWAAVLYLKN